MKNDDNSQAVDGMYVVVDVVVIRYKAERGPVDWCFKRAGLGRNPPLSRHRKNIQSKVRNDLSSAYNTLGV